jgi:prolipoprotein diacylglyceryltransferase
MKADPGGVLLSLKGHWLAGIAGAVLLLAYYYWRDRKARQLGEQSELRDIYPHDRLTEIATVAVISGVVGAKLFTIIEDLPAFFTDPLGMLFSGAGWTIYGGLIGGFLGVTWYLRRKQIPALPVFDSVAPALIIAYGIGRLGCHFAGDGDWGIVAAAQPEWWFLPDWLWAYDYPRNVLNEGVLMEGCLGDYCHHLVPPVYPTPVYETTAAFTIGGILWSLRKRWQAIPGLLFCAYLVFNGIERFFIEKIRVNERYEFVGGLTQAEVIALGLILAGLAWGAWLWSRARKGEDG